VERACRRLSGTAKKLVHDPFHDCHAVKNGSICRRARYSTTKLKSARYELDLHATVCRGRSQARDNVQSPHPAQAGHPVLRLPDHLIPHLHHSNVGTVFFAVGFSVMMVLDVALG